MKQAYDGGLDPLLGLWRAFAVLGRRKLMKVFRAMKIVESLLGVGKDFLGALPDPGSAIGDKTESHLVLGNEAGFFDGDQGGAQFLGCPDLVRADQVFDPVFVDKVEPQALDSSQSPLPLLPR